MSIPTLVYTKVKHPNINTPIYDANEAEIGYITAINQDGTINFVAPDRSNYSITYNDANYICNKRDGYGLVLTKCIKSGDIDLATDFVITEN